MDPDRRQKLSELCLSAPKALPGKEIKPLKFSKIDKFANNMEINLDLAGNALLQALEAFDQAGADIVYWHMKNSSEFIRNAHALTNLERLKLRDPNSANAIKNHIDGAELISPQMKSIIESQKKLTPKYYQNSYYKRRNS
jgi:Asp-tRNA(Asn)/Glu-tRNA(Gln) amidotransferase A subunit family amidase